MDRRCALGAASWAGAWEQGAARALWHGWTLEEWGGSVSGVHARCGDCTRRERRGSCWLSASSRCHMDPHRSFFFGGGLSSCWTLPLGCARALECFDDQEKEQNIRPSACRPAHGSAGRRAHEHAFPGMVRISVEASPRVSADLGRRDVVPLLRPCPPAAPPAEPPLRVSQNQGRIPLQSTAVCCFAAHQGSSARPFHIPVFSIGKRTKGTGACSTMHSASRGTHPAPSC